MATDAEEAEYWKNQHQQLIEKLEKLSWKPDPGRRIHALIYEETAARSPSPRETDMLIEFFKNLKKET